MTENPLFALGPSRDPVGITALVLGALLLAVGLARPRTLEKALLAIERRRFLAGAAALALLLSYGYVVHFLRGGPRIIDATSYYLEARALAEGHFAFPVPEPSAAFRGRFTLLGPDGLSVIFPPGYPLLLALGFRLGQPLLIGPLLAASLVLTTYVAAKELDLGETVARLGAVASVACAALRYHTADTMSHGLSALLLTGTLAAMARPSLARAVLGGVLAGWLVATRPMSGAVGATVTLGLAYARSTSSARPRHLLGAVLGLTPGITLLLIHQKAATGSFFHSTQLAYYALADGPPGCFRWGFGEQVGCRFEHGDFVKRRLIGGFGPLDAVWISGERLLWHAFDLVNFAPAWLLVPWVAWRKRSESSVRWLSLAAALLVLAYLPFYYPGSYPGGGARLLADALPVEHLLLALALAELDRVALLPALAALGFALNTVHAHLALRDREGGRPMFDPSVPTSQRFVNGLLWVETDHGFSLAHDPNARDPRTSLVVARAHGDAHDLALWMRLGRPPAATYEYSVVSGEAKLRDWVPDATAWRWEAEAEWPPPEVRAGWAHPDFRPCLSGGRGLHLRPAPTASIGMEVEAPAPGRYRARLGWLADPSQTVILAFGGSERLVTHSGSGCEASDLGEVNLAVTNRVLATSAQSVILDYLELEPATSK